MKKSFVVLFGVGIFTFVQIATAQDLPINKGKFKPNDESLKEYGYPEWFRDAKFGIWSHWGPQSVPRRGDWYAKKMYQEESKDYIDHLQRFGHPSVSARYFHPK